MPVIAPGQAAGLVHSLLDDRPLAVRGQNERVQIDLKAVGDRVVVDARRQSAGPDERVTVEACALRDLAELVGSVA